MLALELHPTAAGTLLAAAALAAGAPLFADGLRALRVRRGVRALRREPLAGLSGGLAHASGRVALTSPLFSPLSARPCAGWRLSVSSALQPVPRTLEEWRDFRLVEDGASVTVEGHAARWDLMVTAWREVAPGEALPESLRALIERLPDGRWLRASGQPLRLVEHALFAGAAAHVVGGARREETLVTAVAVARAEQVTLQTLRTGTDDAVVMSESAGTEAASATASDAAVPGWTLGADDGTGLLRVSDAPPDPARMRVSALRLAGLALGPLCGLAGMLYLAHLADWLRVHGGF